MSSPKSSGGVFRTEIDDGTLIVKPCGDQAAALSQRFYEEIEEVRGTIRKGSLQHVLVDASAVDYLSSAVIGGLIELWECATENGCKFAVCGLSDFALEALSVTRLDTRWPRYDDRESAIQSLRNS